MTLVDPVQLWLDALRSGDYKQGQRVLHRVDTPEPQFCCLGVACDLYQKHVGDLIVARTSTFVDEDNAAVMTYDCERGFLPPQVRAWLGLSTTNGYHRDEDGSSSLTVLNDMGADFEQIANVIESRPEGLFEPVAA